MFEIVPAHLNDIGIGYICLTYGTGNLALSHHGRNGGRAVELLLLFALLVLTITLICLGFLGAMYLLLIYEIESRYSVKFGILGAALGGLVAGRIWKKFLKFYRYSTDFKPISKTATIPKNS